MNKAGWISVKEQLPQASVPVLAYAEKKVRVCYVVSPTMGLWTDGHFPRHVTHWMPFPEPPKEVTDDEKAY